MNTGRFISAALGVWIVRVVLNGTFYNYVVGKRYAEIASGHPSMFRTVVPAYIAADLIFALVFAFLFAKVGTALGAGVKAGVTLGVFVGILSPVVGNVYRYYSVTFLPLGLVAVESVFQLIAHAIEGAIAGLIYKTRAENV